MTWRRMIAVMAALMLLPLLAVYFFVSRLEIPGVEMEIMGVHSVFPAGRPVPVTAAKNNWQGFAFAGNFRFFRRPSAHAGDDHQKLKRDNFPAAPLQAELDLFDGGWYTLRKAGKGYRLACIFHRGGTNYWADMATANSMDFSRRVFERFILNLRIDGEKVSPRVAGQVAALSGEISPLFMQTPDMLLGMMAAGFILALLIAYLSNRFSGSCPRRGEPDAGTSTPYATLRVGGFGRRRISACCLRHEGGQLVIYRFRRPFMKIDIAAARHEIVWETSSFRYKNIRVILPYAEFQGWRAILMA